MNFVVCSNMDLNVTNVLPSNLGSCIQQDKWAYIVNLVSLATPVGPVWVTERYVSCLRIDHRRRSYCFDSPCTHYVFAPALQPTTLDAKKARVSNRTLQILILLQLKKQYLAFASHLNTHIVL